MLIVLPWLKQSSWSFPPIAQVVPSENGRGTGDRIPEVNPAYLVDAAKVADTLQRAAREYTALTITIGHLGGELDPMRLDVNLRGVIIAQIVIMPMRSEPGTIPATHTGVRPHREFTEVRTETTPADDRPIGKRDRKPRTPKVKATPVDETAHAEAA